MTDFFAGHTPAPHRLLVRVSPAGWRVSRNGIELDAGPETGPQGLQLAWKAADLATAETGWGPGVGFPPEEDEGRDIDHKRERRRVRHLKRSATTRTMTTRGEK